MSQVPEITILSDNVRRFAQRVVAPALAELNHFPDQPLPEGLVPGLAELGLFELGPDEDGSSTLLSALLGTLSEVAAAPAALLLANAFAREVLRAAGGPRSRALLAEHASAPFAYALYSEPGMVDDAPSVRRVGGDIELHGTAELVVNAPLAEVVVLPVRDTDAHGALALIALETREAGVEVGDALLTLGMRGCATADVSFRRARFPADRVVVWAPRAAVVVAETARRLRGPALAIAAGVLESSVRTAADYAKQRHQGGCPIIEHQEVRAILGRMLEDQALCRQASALLAQGALPETQALGLFVRAKERAAHAACDGVQLLGGNGYMEDYGQERAMRDAKQAQCLLGRTDFARQVLTASYVAEGAGP